MQQRMLVAGQKEGGPKNHATGARKAAVARKKNTRAKGRVAQRKATLVKESKRLKSIWKGDWL